MDDDVFGFGDSYGIYEIMVIVGNIFDYFVIYGEVILKVGYLFIFCSDESIVYLDFFFKEREI